MWILPKQLMSAFALDTEALTLDSVELSQTCAQSLMRRSKPSPAKTFLREWKAGNLMRLRSGAISSPSLGQSFLGWWTFSLAATRVSHSVQQASEPEQMTQDTCGHLSQVAFKFYDPDCVSSRMLKDTLALDSEKSLQTWKALVTKRRGEYSQRLSAARLTSAKESSSWPSPVASEVRQGFQDRSRGMKGSQESLTTVVLKTSGLLDPVNPSTHGSRPELWATPSAFDGQRPAETMEEWKIRNAKKKEQNPNLGTLHKPLTVQVTEQKNRPELWLTPRANEPTADNNFVARNGDRGEHCHVSLTSQTKAWATPEGMAGGKISRGGKRKDELLLTGQVKQSSNGKLNPRWVETLMGLPVGWTMPSCQFPMTTAQTNCACLGTESSQQQQH